MSLEQADVVVGSGFGGAIPAYHLAAGGARVVVLERGPWLQTPDFVHDLHLGSFSRFLDFVVGVGNSVVAGNCVGGSSVVYFAASLRAPSFVFERQRNVGRRQWPAGVTRASLDPWYDRVEDTLPVTVLAMTEDDNEGVFGPPPATGSFTPVTRALGTNTISYRPTENTLRGWAAADEEARAVFERDGLGKVRPFTSKLIGAITAHPLASCRIGDDPGSSALDPWHELRGHAGIFVTDGSAVPTSLCVNPSLTIAALAERSMPGIVARAQDTGVPVRYGAPAPDGATVGRDGVLRLPLVRRVAARRAG